jgi:hypothetical protein
MTYPSAATTDVDAIKSIIAATAKAVRVSLNIKPRSHTVATAVPEALLFARDIR